MKSKIIDFIIIATIGLLIATFFNYNKKVDGIDSQVANYVTHHVTDSTSWHPNPWMSVDFPQDKIVNIFGHEIDMSLSLNGFFVLVICVIMLILFIFVYKKDSRKAPKGITNFLEVFVLFVRDEIAVEQMGEKDGKAFTPFLLTLFFFILIANYLGMIPGAATPTGNWNVAGALAFAVFTIMIIFGFKNNGPLGFWKLFVPPGIPFWTVPLLFPIEFIGNLLIKPAVLMVRLAANMTAGHIVIFSLIGIIVSYGSAISFVSMILVVFIFTLELLVAFIQAYLFTLLTSMFVGSVLHQHH